MEEQAYLVAGSDSENSSKLSFGSIPRNMTYTEGRLTEMLTPTSDCGGDAPEGSGVGAVDVPEASELIDYNEASILSQFHEDAIKQVGCGIAQVRVLLACSLAIAGAALELTVVPFILPSAEIELCILYHEKSWLALITLVGLCCGSAGWGNLSDRLGRRRTLVSCLAVNAVFATIAAFMPTYGTFMMARFCSAVGSGGIIPASCAYASEMVPARRRRVCMPLLMVGAGVGAVYACVAARLLLPPTGTDTLIENKHHFSAWHRYLLLCTLPILAALVSLIWTQESPRYLLEVGREVDAMMVYQSIHSSNQIKICGNANVVAMSGDSDYRLGELELPGKRRPAVHHMRHNVKMFWHGFFQLFSSAYLHTTLRLGGILFFTMFLQFTVSAYTPAFVGHIENQQFQASQKIVINATYNNEHYNDTLWNIEFINSTFVGCTFKDIFMSHVTFRNCSFYSTNFSSIKTSYTSFKGTLFVNSSIVDTDMELSRDFDPWCVTINTVVRGISSNCGHPDLTSRLAPLLAERAAAAYAILAAAPAATLIERAISSHSKRLLVLSIISAACSPALYFLTTETALYALEAAYGFLLALMFYGATIMLIESYPASLRCTGHGVIMSVVYVGAGVAQWCAGAMVVTAAPAAAALALAAALATTILIAH